MFIAFGGVQQELAAQEDSVGPTNFHFEGINQAATIGNIAHYMLMTGYGRATSSQVVGGGSFVHFDNASPVPKTILSSGTWRAKRVVSFELIGTWGVAAAGVLEMEVELIREIPSPAVIPVQLTVVCNIGVAGLRTGQDEGYFLTIPDTPFGTFKPFVPPAGVTLFTTGIEEGAGTRGQTNFHFVASSSTDTIGDVAHRILITGDDKVTTPVPHGDGILINMAGIAGEPGGGGDGHAATAAHLYWPQDITASPTGEVYILDWNNHCVRWVEMNGTISRVIGSGHLGDGSSGLADTINLNHPTGLTIGPSGNFWLAAWHNWKVKKIDRMT
ncbi:hypothetical protein HYR99_30545 [Candidatus Poribacteria bacterium]|nr:hypothetical protein [Candidatus Poribacteria bacterium]